MIAFIIILAAASVLVYIGVKYFDSMDSCSGCPQYDVLNEKCNLDRCYWKTMGGQNED